MLIRTMKIFRHLLVLYKVEDCLVYATSAFRDAANGEKILDDIRRKTRMEIRIISGEEEARIIHDDFHAPGIINKLIRLTDSDDENGTELSVEALDSLYRQMSGMSIDELMEKYDLRESRADVIVHAARLFLMVAEKLCQP